MQTATILTFASLAFSCALTGFVFAARSRGWPVGEMFARGTVPTFVSIACLAVAVGYLIASAVGGSLGWWAVAGGVAAYFIGGPMVMAILGRNSGLISLIAAPVCAIASLISSV